MSKLSMGKSKKPDPVKTGFPEFDVRRFFEAVGKDPERAVRMVGEQISDDGLPSPRAESYVSTGEWDGGRVGLLFVPADGCQGLIGDDDSHRRFCGARGCTIKAHQPVKKLVGFRAGWYIHSGSGRGGCYRTACFESASSSGPITPAVAKALTDKVDPFKLSVGQWKFILDSYYRGRTATESPFSDESYAKVSSFGDEANDEEDEDAGRAPEVSSFAPVKEEQSPLLLMLSTTAGASAKGVSNAPNAASGNLSDPAVLKTLFENLEDRIDRLQHRIVQEESVSKDLERRAVVAESLLSNMTARVAKLGGLDVRITELGLSVSDIKDVLLNPVGDVGILKDQVEKLVQAADAGSGVSRHGVTLSSPSDAAGLLMSIQDDVGIFHDATSLLHSITGSTISHKASLSEMKAQKDVKLGSDIQARVITSFRTNLPAILYGGSSTTDAVEDYVTLNSKLKSYSTWHSDDGMSGVSQRIQNGIQDVHKRVRFLSNKLTSDPLLQRLSNGLIIDSIHFVQSLITFIDTTWMEYRVSTFFTDSQVWELLVAFIEQIFDDIREARCEVQDAAEDQPALLLWGILKAHKVMDEYLEREFKNHPNLIGILVQKVLRSSPSAKVQNQQSKIDGLESKVRSLTSKIAALETKTAKMPAHPS